MKILLPIVILVVLAAAGAAAWFFFAPPAHVTRVLLDLERGRAGLAPATVDAAGFRIAYLHGGRGEPLILLHGFGADKDNWTPIARHLTARFRVIAPDLPGFGDSDKPASARYRTQDQVAYLHAFLRALGLDAVHLGGNSMGGRIAAEYAATYPGEVRSLWLLAPGGVMSAEASEMMQQLPAADRIPLLARTPAELEQVLALVTADPPPLPRPLKLTLAARAGASYALHRTIFEEIRAEWTGRPLEQLVAGLPTPTRIVWGREDRVLHPSGADVLTRVMPHASVLTLPDIGHLPMLEAPKRVASDYLAFREAVAR